MAILNLGFSPCPNDTFMFAGLANGWVRGNLKFNVTILDVETLNSLVTEEKIDISKISCHTLYYVQDKYCLLPVGAALGYGCGPLLITRPELSLNDLSSATIAIPGKYTTAYLLLRLYAPYLRKEQVVFLPFDQIIKKVSTKQADFGLIIHEGRFVYSQYGLKSVLDLGKWWENQTHLPLPLGCIVAKKSLGKEKIEIFTQMLRESILFAYKHFDRVMEYVKKHAAYLGEQVIKQHIELYVNQFSLNLGEQGRRAIQTLIARIEKREKASGYLFCN